MPKPESVAAIIPRVDVGRPIAPSPSPAVEIIDPTVHHLRYAGVPLRFLSRRLANFTARPGTTRARTAADAMVSGTAAGLVLSGPPGTGKTHLAVGILAARHDRWLATYPRPWWEVEGEDYSITVERRPPLDQRFVVVPSFLDDMRRAINYRDPVDPLPALFDVDLLVLDDLGREKVTDWASERLYVLVNERYNRIRPTIVTTNYTPDELAQRGYDALVSRLVEGAGVVALTASDHRSQGGR